MTTAPTRKFRLLIVEDNPADVELFRRALKRAQIDFELSVIGDGGEALDMVRRENASPEPQTPDLIVLDLNLPKADGREILAEMRATGAFANVPVVVLTSSTSRREKEELQVFRIARHLSKPPDLDEFLNLGAVVKEVLSTQVRPVA
jgi:CheY-like chemotaxis protein